MSPTLKTSIYFCRKKFFLYIGKWNFLGQRLKNFRRNIPSSKNKKQPILKKSLIFLEIELSSLKLKKLLYIHYSLAVFFLLTYRALINVPYRRYLTEIWICFTSQTEVQYLYIRKCNKI